MKINGQAPNLILIVRVEEAFMHCPKCMIRSGLWKNDQWPERSNVPTHAEALVAHAALTESVATVQARIDKDVSTRLCWRSEENPLAQFGSTLWAANAAGTITGFQLFAEYTFFVLWDDHEASASLV